MKNKAEITLSSVIKEPLKFAVSVQICNSNWLHMRSVDVQRSACVCVFLLWKTALKEIHPNLYFTFQVTFQDPGSLVYFGFCIFMLIVLRIKNFKVHVKASRFSGFELNLK